MRKSDLKITIEALRCSAQEQAIRTNCVKYLIDKKVDSSGGIQLLYSHLGGEGGSIKMQSYMNRGRGRVSHQCERLLIKIPVLLKISVLKKLYLVCD